MKKLFLLLLLPVLVFAQPDFEETKRLAEQGHPLAQTQLGLMYYNGIGVSQDYVEAAKWYRRGAEQGYAFAQLALGLMYGLGEGVPQNYSEAYVWTSLAAAQGLVDAKEARDMAARELNESRLSAAQARAVKLFEEIQARQ